jgi:geranyl-CoA carboxylase alpha subunit
LHTTLIDDWAAQGAPILARPQPDEHAWQLAAAVRAHAAGDTGAGDTRDRRNLRSAALAAFDLTLVCGDARRMLRVRSEGASMVVTHDGAEAAIELLSLRDGELRYRRDGVIRRCLCVDDGHVLWIAREGTSFAFTEPSPLPDSTPAADPGRLRAPLAGVVAQLKVSPGDRVAPGAPLLCVEAMKMETWLAAGAAGTVRALHVRAGEQVAAGTLLVEIDLED